MKKQVLTNDEVKENLAANLKRILSERKISQAKFARAIGVSPMAVSHYMSGRNATGAAAVSRMAVFLGVSIESLITKPVVKIPKPPRLPRDRSCKFGA